MRVEIKQKYVFLYVILFFMLHIFVLNLVVNLVQTGLIFLDTLTNVLQIEYYENEAVYMFNNNHISITELVRYYQAKASVISSGVYAVLLPFAYLLLTKFFIFNFKKEASANKTKPVNYLSGFVMGLAALFPINALVMLTPLRDASPEIQQSFNNIFAQTPLWLIILSLGILAPIAEELTFRGMIQSFLKKGMSAYPAIILQAVLFGLMHFNLQQFVYTTIFGIALGLICHWSNSIYPSILAHIAFNTLSSLSSLILPEEMSALMFLGITAASLIVALLCLRIVYKNRDNNNTEPAL